MKIVLMSDSHGRHENIYVMKPEDDLQNMETLYHITGGVYLPPVADMIIHAGDISMRGQEFEVENFLKWYSSLPYKYKVLIAGNHDFLFDIQRTLASDLLKKYPDIIYIENDMVEIEGLKIWGSPIQPWFHNWAFNKYRGEDIKKFWDIIPNDIDILVTHGPPFGILDMTMSGDQVGCEDLMAKIKEIPTLKLHVFGHIHEHAGYEFKDGVHYINASVLNLRYQLQNRPQIFEVAEDKTITKI
jgi:Icc-related predicted phosphoesterase